MIDPKSFVGALQDRGVDLFCGVPDSLLASLCACISDVIPPERNLICANEGAAVGLCVGWHVACGRAGCVYLQNSGEGNVVNPLLSLADPDVYEVPLLLVVGWRGEPGVADEPQHAKQGKVTVGLLEAMGVPYAVLDEGCWESQVADALDVMWRKSRPVALVVRKGTFAPWGFVPPATDATMLREEALEAILGELGDDDVVVSTTGKESREVFEVRECRGQGHDHDFLVVGGMGHTSSVALGLAMGCERPVWCLDGDGSLVMHMGSLAVTGAVAPRNLRYVVNVNGVHESVGGQPNVAGTLDVAALLRDCGFSVVREAHTPDEVSQAVRQMRDEHDVCALVLHTCPGSRANLGRPTTTPRQNKESLMRLLGSWSRTPAGDAQGSTNGAACKPHELGCGQR